jgi:hypothetical protein
MSTTTDPTITVRGVKINTLIPPQSLAADLVPAEPQPAGNPTLRIAIADSPIVLVAPLSGKSVRKALKAIAEHGADGVNVLLQGNLKPSEVANVFLVEAAGLSVTPKAPRAE